MDEAKANKKIKLLEKRYGKGHLYYACHIAFPLTLTSGLMYQIWYCFRKDNNNNLLMDDDNKTIIIPWVAIYDIIFSSICREIAYDQYELQPEIRKVLLTKLKENPLFGVKRLNELANFLYAYYEKIEGEQYFADADCKDTNKLYAEAVLNPGSESVKSFLSGNFYFPKLITDIFEFAKNINKSTSEDVVFEAYEEITIDVSVNEDELRRELNLRTNKKTVEKIIDSLPKRSNDLLINDYDDMDKIVNHLLNLYDTENNTLNRSKPKAVIELENRIQPPVQGEQTQPVKKYDQKPCIIIGIGEIGAKLVYGVFQNWVEFVRDIHVEDSKITEVFKKVDFFVYDTPHKNKGESVLGKIEKDQLAKKYPKGSLEVILLSDTNYIPDTEEKIQEIRNKDYSDYTPDTEEKIQEQRNKGYSEWLSSEPPSNPVIIFDHGAESDREKGRMAFLASLVSKREPSLEKLETALKKYLSPSGEPNIPSLEIVIVNSLFGGTGSGTFIQFALYLKDYINRHIAENKNLPLRIGFVSIVSDSITRSKEKKNEKNAIEELKLISEKGIINLQNTYGTIIHKYIHLFDYCCIYNDEERIPESLDDLKDNVISKSIFYQNISPISNTVINHKYKSIESPFTFCNPLAYEFVFPKEKYEKYKILKAVNLFMNHYFPRHGDKCYNYNRQYLKEKADFEKDPFVKQYDYGIFDSTYQDKNGQKEKKEVVYSNRLEKKQEEDFEQSWKKYLDRKEVDFNILVDQKFMNAKAPTKKSLKNFQIEVMETISNELYKFAEYLKKESMLYETKVLDFIARWEALQIKNHFNDLHPVATRILLCELNIMIDDKINTAAKQKKQYQKEIDDCAMIENQDATQLNEDDYKKLVSHYEKEIHLKRLKELMACKFKIVFYLALKKIVENYIHDHQIWFSKIDKQKHEFEIKEIQTIEELQDNRLTFVENHKVKILDLKRPGSFKSTYHKEINDIANDQLELSRLKILGRSTHELKVKVNNDTKNFFIKNALTIYKDLDIRDTQVNIIDAIKQDAEFDDQPIQKRLSGRMEAIVKRIKKKGYPSEIIFLMHPECYQELIKLEVNPFKKEYYLWQSEFVSPHKIICFCDNYLKEIKTDFHQEFRKMGTIKRFFKS